jgi:hypothetical protein
MKVRLLSGWWAGLFWWGGAPLSCFVRRFYEDDQLVVWLLFLGPVEFRLFKPVEGTDL